MIRSVRMTADTLLRTGMQGERFMSIVTRIAATIWLAVSLTTASNSALSPPIAHADLVDTQATSYGLSSQAISSETALEDSGMPDRVDVLDNGDCPDVNGDNLVGGVDVLRVSLAFGSQYGMDVRYDTLADVNSDNIIDGNDLALVAAFSGTTCD
jgi:hypothetical protein